MSEKQQLVAKHFVRGLFFWFKGWDETAEDNFLRAFLHVDSEKFVG